MGDINVVNPGLVNVADQADGLTVVEQTITVTRPSTNSGPTAQGLTYADGLVVVEQPITVTVPATGIGPVTQAADLAPGLGVETESPSTRSDAMTAQRTVEGGTDSPTKAECINTTDNTVVGQPESTQQFSHTINVFV
jgi:hypothetical protein